MYVKLCMMVILVKLYFQWPLLYFRVTALSNSSNWKYYVLIRLSQNFVRLLIMSGRAWIYHYFDLHRCSREIIDIFPCLNKSISDTFKAKSFKCCMILTLLGVCIFIVGLITFTFFQGHRSVRNHHHHHLSLNHEGHWGTTDDFATSFLHFPLLSTALWDLADSRPVHSLMLSSHLFLCLPCLLPPFTVPCKMVLARPDERETWPCHCS